MVRFLIYMFESGICLLMFYFGYILFFRKETYFKFNRIYLTGSMILALIIPLIHTTITLNNSDKLQERFLQVEKFRNYYEELIYMTDPDLNRSESFLNQKRKEKRIIIAPEQIDKTTKSSFNLAQLIFFIYLIGFLFFFFRLLYLFIWLKNLIKNNKITHHNGYKLVHLQADMPSFSFFSFIFINTERLTDFEYEQVIDHEMEHIRQKHSIDLMIAHIIYLFQWYNPLVWRIRKSIKTIHEYLVDRKVVEQGHELFDYQSLLLSQLISIRSVELVSNFNLLSIKKRIAMMNKKKSGFMAKMKAVAVIPITIIVFIFFANLTIRNPISNINSEEISDELNIDLKLSGSVLKVDLPSSSQVRKLKKNDYSFRIIIAGDRVEVAGNNGDFRELEELLKLQKANYSEEQLKRLPILIEIDKNSFMKEVSDIKNLLRKLDMLKLAYAVEKDGISCAEDGSWSYGFVFKLPPLDVEIIGTDELNSKGIGLYEIDAMDKTKTVNDIETELIDFIQNHKKYVMSLNYSDKTVFQDYLIYRDLVYKVIFDLREKKARQKYEKTFEDLFDEKQAEIIKETPITLMTINTDRDL